jgi:hypothetical protein
MNIKVSHLCSLATSLLLLGLCSACLLLGNRWPVKPVESRFVFEARSGVELLGVSGELRCRRVDGSQLSARLTASLRETESLREGRDEKTGFEIEIDAGELNLPAPDELHSCAYFLISRVLDRRGFLREGRTLLVGDLGTQRMSRFELESLVSDRRLHERLAERVAALVLKP